MTYKKNLPDLVFKRWLELNKDYTIDFSLDADCISFLQKHFNSYIAELFTKIPIGMYKADLWRLCRLYIDGGVYADVDLVPYLRIDTLDNDNTFYSCLSFDNKSIFQAFMRVAKPKNPLILNFLLSFLINNPYNYKNGPTYDMYNCLSYNLNNDKLKSETPYTILEIKIPIQIGSSTTNTKIIDLYYFPPDVEYSIVVKPHPHEDKFKCIIEGNKLIITRIDANTGWDYTHCLDICIKCNERILLFKENMGSSWITSYISHNNTKILDSRDLTYHNNGGW